MPGSSFSARAPSPRTHVVAPWSYRDTGPGPFGGPYAIGFVGEELWAQTCGCVWRLAAGCAPRLFRTTNVLSLVRTEGRWVEFRTKSGWSTPPWSAHTEGIHLFSLDDDDWYEGPWPEGLSCWMREAIEPEDFVLVDPFAGRSLDVALNDRHEDPVFGPRSRIASIDGQVVDLATGALTPTTSLRVSDALEELFPVAPPLAIADATDALPAEDALAQAIARPSSGSVWWVEPGVDQRVSIVGVDDRALAVLSSHWRAAAFDAEARRLALVSPRRVRVLRTDQLDGPPSFAFEFPWPWPDPYETAELAYPTDGLVARQREYRREYGQWIAQDSARRENAPSPELVADDEAVNFVVTDGDEDIPF